MTLANKPPGTTGPAASHRTGYELVATKIIELIVSTDLKPGDRLPPERALSEQLGVSRTVIREAIKMLNATGVVRAQQGSGLYVSNEPHPLMTTAIDVSMTVQPEDVLNMFEFRTSIEIQTARLAAERITPKELRRLQDAVERNRQDAEAREQEAFHESDADFHRGIAEATRNPFFISAVQSISRLQTWVTLIVTGGPPGSLLLAAEEHAAIFNAIHDGNPEEAARTMQTHIQTVITSYQQEVRRRLRSDLSSE